MVSLGLANVGNGEEAAKELWCKGAIRVLPGRYLAAEDPDGRNSGTPYIRVALVHDRNLIQDALGRLVEII